MKPNGKLDAPVEAASSPPRTTLLGTIFSPVFNFFSPATKTGKTKELLDTYVWKYLTFRIDSRKWLKVHTVLTTLVLLLPLWSHSWFGLSWPSDGGRGNHETAGHWAGRRNAKQHSHIHRGHHSVSHWPNAATKAPDYLRYNHRRRGDCDWNRHAPINRYEHPHVKHYFIILILLTLTFGTEPL